MTSLLLMVASGFVTWTLALGRSLAWDARHTPWLICIVTVDEFIGIRVGQYLARTQSWVDALAVAAGASVAVLVVMRWKGKQ
jgi:hypothetical protein